MTATNWHNQQLTQKKSKTKNCNTTILTWPNDKMRNDRMTEDRCKIDDDDIVAAMEI